MRNAVQPLLRSGPAVPDGAALDGIGVLARETLGERVTLELRGLLMSGQLAPGEKLSLRRIAEALGVSMMPVREAVSRLAADGALEVLPGRAVRVPVMTRRDFRELTQIRLVVEGAAIEEAARRVQAGDLALIRGYEAHFRAVASCEPPDAVAAVRANHALHFAIYRAAAMPLLLEMIERLWLKAGPVINLDMRDEPLRLKGGFAVQAHAAMLDALGRNDPVDAKAALLADISAAARHIEATGQLTGVL